MSDYKVKILIVDDEQTLRDSVKATLLNIFPDNDLSIEEASNGLEAVEKSKAGEFDIVLMDVKMPKMSGLEALEEIKNINPKVTVVIMTAHSNFPDAVQAVKNGAYDYLEKPVDTEKLSLVINQARKARSLIKNLHLNLPIFDDDLETEFVGSSKKMREIFTLIDRLAKVETTVLIRGENGTGKEMVAQAIHFSSSKKSGPFVAINCGAIPENLIESELFGHEKGSFTGAHARKIGKFQLANNGTLFLDEIAELAPNLQVKLLRVLQDKKFTPVGSPREIKTSARIIAATNQNIEKMIETKMFREDLFYRLNVMPIFLPPLKERIDDLEDLAYFFIKKFNIKYENQIKGIAPRALAAMKNYNWPGNIRQLENTVERAYIVETSEMITEKSLPELLIQKAQIDTTAGSSESQMDFDKFKEQSEKDFIIQALRQNQGRINKTVAEANIPKNTLLRKIKKYEIDVKQFQES